MKKYFAEAVGTMVLVLMGCGVAVSLNCTSDCSTVANAASVIGTAFAFGLAVVAMAYTIGGISGCHINPAITGMPAFRPNQRQGCCGLYLWTDRGSLHWFRHSLCPHQQRGWS